MKAIAVLIPVLVFLTQQGGMCEDRSFVIEIEFPSVSGEVSSGSYCAATTMGGGASGVFFWRGADDSPILGTGSGTGELEAGAPEPKRWEFALRQNCPNPFRGATRIRFSIPGLSGESRKVTVKVFDVRGRLVNVLLDDNVSAGEHYIVWPAPDRRRAETPSGVYFIQVKCGSNCATKRVVLLR